MNLVILDILANNFNEIKKHESIFDNSDILALTPSSIYYLEHKNIIFQSFHDLTSTEEFKNIVLDIYENILLSNSKNKYFKGYFRDVAQVISQLLIVDKIKLYVEDNTFKKVIYITDKEIGDSFNLEKLTNSKSLLNYFIHFDEIIQIKRNIIENKMNFYKKLQKYSFGQLLKKFLFKLSNKHLKYDWAELNLPFHEIEISKNAKFLMFKIDITKFHYIKNIELTYSIEESTSKLANLLTFMEKDTFNKIVNLNKRDLYFFQHGNYLYKNIFIKYSEIEPASINFVFNDFTKKLFKNLGAKKVYTVGSILFNKQVKKRKKEYDFLYITQGHDYLGNLQYVDFLNSMHSFDGYELYQRHKNIIKLFGTTFKDKKILIRVHPAVVTTGVYVPFWELAEKYPNIIIDVSIPIHTLIEKSKFIISDYFTTEFINRELHYKRDIILFQGAPTPLPKETIEDMEKMFILVDTVDDLEEKVSNIETITKDRPRYDDIIEYYSSKKCDTKKVVTEIIEKELNARR